MSRCRALAVSAVTAATVALAAPTAVAWDDPNSIVVSPNMTAPGGQITVSVDAPECRSTGGTVSSPVFPTTPLQGMPGSNRVSASVRVNQNARAGSYSVTVRCDGRSITKQNAFTVIGGVQGGLGGSSTGTAPTDIAIGGGLVAVALVSGGVVMMRRHSARRAA
ncbi:hypothetical protein [Streptomyces odontomachi]|uniref:hypothetical protein n=1 Tax=Streptomyces odontomachi TaxID=2944940 RepID=UPI002109A90A|nr:hypothetical protein [Streptomyces sp. ODS25]